MIQTRCVERDLLEKVIAVIIFNQHGSLSMKAHLLSLRRLSQHICRYSIFQLSHHFIDMHLLEGQHRILVMYQHRYFEYEASHIIFLLFVKVKYLMRLSF